MFFGGVNDYAALDAYHVGPVGPFKVFFMLRCPVLPAANQPGGVAHILPEALTGHAAPEVKVARRLARTNNVIFHGFTSTVQP